MEEIVVNNHNDNNNNNNTGSKTSLERRIRPQKEQALNCPRCNSTNTKFCYYNNYSLTQPRYFCKTCRRYWTEGGTLRNIPVGGGSRKNKRSSSSSNGSSSSSLLSPPSTVHSSRNKLPDLIQTAQNPKVNGGQDLNLGFPLASGFKSFSELINMPNFDEKSNNDSSALELLTGSRRLNYYMPVGDQNGVYTSGFPLPEFKATSLSFSLDGIGNSGYGSGIQEGTNGRLLFPFEDLKVQVPSITTTTNDHVEQNRENGDSSGVYWNGVLGGGGGGSW
ncbi:hypothetical protein LguiA_034437 [Lonicera macranthoides]